MSRVNRPPKGLQYLLGSQSFGDNPSELDMNIRPSIDLKDFYTGELLRIADVTSGAVIGETSIGFIEMTGPAIIIAAGLKCTTAFTTAERFACNFRIDNLGNGTGLSVPFYEHLGDYDAGNSPAAGMVFDTPLHVPAGAQLSCYINAYSGNALSITFGVVYVDLSVEPNP